MTGNDKISLWMGRPCTCVHGTEIDSGVVTPTRYWGKCAMHGLGGLSIQWETSEQRAVELMAVFSKHRLGVRLESTIDTDGWVLTVFRHGAERLTFEAPTIAQAVCGAVLQIIQYDENVQIEVVSDF
jgi:hypothetical protein